MRPRFDNSQSSPTAIRARREQLGLSQAELAKQLGVTKSLLSYIESGKRQLTEEQVVSLGRILGIPPDMLLLATGRLPDDVKGAFAQNAAGAVAAIRRSNEVRVVALPAVPSNLPLQKPATERTHGSIPRRIDVRKTSTTYRAHSYHTKVPPEAIVPFIRAFTEPGGTVLDPFCGSGMTGVAALMEGRNALLSDFSPAAIHIARNYTRPCDPKEYVAALARIEQTVAPTIDWLYRPPGAELVEYTTWSDVYRCPSCAAELLYWDLVHHEDSVDADRIRCSECNALNRKADLEWLREQPVVSNVAGGGKRVIARPPSSAERSLIAMSDAAPIPYWFPTDSFGSDREMWRGAHRAMGIVRVSEFFTRRNLHALAALRHAIVTNSDGRVRDALLFAFTASVNRASRRYQWNAKRPTNVMTGTLYVSSLRYEWNVWSLFRRKAADVLRYYQSFPATASQVDVFMRSATELDCIPDQSIDLVFMDPPFGSNIFYADSSLLWDAWLGELTDQQSEIVVNKRRTPSAGGKSLDDYGELMRSSFEHAARVLRTGGRSVLAFSNSDDEVWTTIQNALREAGLDTESVHLLNKSQPSIKGVKGQNGSENVTSFDLLLCLKRRRATYRGSANSAPAGYVDDLVRRNVQKEAARTDEIYSSVVRSLIEKNYSVAGVTMPVVAEKCREHATLGKDNRWQPLLARQATEAPQDLVQGYLTDVRALPCSARSTPVTTPLGRMAVTGGRNSSFYLAHSYHTKVPPEAITPFIEHYTKPGDVILDPFCGSGMTGVAAALSGRRAILNDLSPAAIHLSWNHTHACNPDSLQSAFNSVETRVKARFKELYGVRHSSGTEATAHWTMWSTRHRCPSCKETFLLWEVMDKKSGRLGNSIACPRCKQSIGRTRLKSLGSEPAWIAYETTTGRRFERSPSADEVKRILSFRREDISAWYPTVILDPEREMYVRCALQLQGIETVADFYTPRNLEALALLWEAIRETPGDRERRALAFAFTNTAWHGTRMRRFNARGGQRPLTGTLYIPQLSSEANVLEVMRNKIAQLQRYYRSYQPNIDAPGILLGSATDLSTIANGSIDYVFTDPPFGSNIFYSDCNFIWEAWLGRLTDAAKEAVVNRSRRLEKGGKSITDYQTLIAGAMKEIARVLKPSGWATVVFHNTDASVWQAIRDAATEAGFVFHEASSLTKQQQSHKGYKGRSETEDVAHFDVVFNLRKTKGHSTRRKSAPVKSTLDLHALVRGIMADPRIAARGLQGVHAEAMRQMASDGYSEFVSFADIRAIWDVLKDTNVLPFPSQKAGRQAPLAGKKRSRVTKAAKEQRRRRHLA